MIFFSDEVEILGYIITKNKTCLSRQLLQIMVFDKLEACIAALFQFYKQETFMLSNLNKNVACSNSNPLLTCFNHL